MLSGFTSAINISVFGTSNMAGFKSATRQLETFAGNFEKTAKRVRAAGFKTALIGAGIAASLVAPAITAAKFNTQIAQTSGLLGASQTEMQAVAQTAERLGATSMFTATQVAESQESLARLGLTAADVGKETGIMGANVAFATGQQRELADSGMFLVGTMNAMRISFDQADMVADKLTTTITRSGNNFDTLQESMANSAGTAMSYGQSMDTLLAVLGVLADRQEKGARAGTRLSMTMTKIYTQGDKIEKALGVEVYDQATGKTRDLIDVFTDMQGKLKGMSEEAKNNTLTEIFGAEGIKVFNLLLTSSEEELTTLKTKITESEGAAKALNDIITGSDVGVWRLMTSAVSAVTKRIGDDLMPMVRALEGWVTRVANGFWEWMNANPLLTKLGVTVAAVGAVALITAGGVMILGGSMLMLSSMALKLPGEITKIAYSMKLVNTPAAGAAKSLFALGRSFLSVLWPIALIVGGVYLLTKAWNTNFWGMKTAVLSTWQAIKPPFVAIGEKISGLYTTVREAIGGMIERVVAWGRQWYATFTEGVPPFLRMVGAVAFGLGFMVGSFARTWAWIQENPIVTGLLFASLAAFAWPMIATALAALWTFATQTVLANTVAAGGFLISRVAMVANAVVSLWANRSFLLVRGSILAMAIASRIAAGAQWLLNAAIGANPISRLIGLVFLLGSWMVSAWKRSEGFGDFLKTMFNDVIGLVNNFIKLLNHIPGVNIPLFAEVTTSSNMMGPPEPAVQPGVIKGLRAKNGMEGLLTAPNLDFSIGDALSGNDIDLPSLPDFGFSPGDILAGSAATSTTVDKSISVGDINVMAGPNEPAKSVKDQVLDALREAAGEGDGIDGVSYAGA